MKLPFIGLMGVGSDCMLYTPDGKELFRVPEFLAWRIQNIQHKIAQFTWRYQ